MEGAKPGEANTDWGAVDPTQNNVSGYFNVLPGNIRLGAVGRYPHRAHACGIGPLERFLGGDTWQNQGRDSRMRHRIGNGFNPFPVRVRAKTIIEAGAI